MNQKEKQTRTAIFEVVKELCDEKNIHYSQLSDDWVIELEKDEKVRHIVNNRFDINKSAAGIIASDKYATYEVLKQGNIEIIEHRLFHNPKVRKDYIPEQGNEELIRELAEKYSLLVVKPNDGAEGKNVWLCKGYEETKKAVDKIFETEFSLSICPYYDIKVEYRTFYLNGECILTYGKQRPYVVVEEEKTLRDILIEKNINKIEYEELEKINNINLDGKVQKGIKVYTGWKHNLSNGASPIKLADDELKNKIQELTKKATKRLNINFASVDIIHTNDDKLYVLEVNSGVCMTKFMNQVENGREFAKLVYGKAIDLMFEN